jgi:hypothetical protein
MALRGFHCAAAVALAATVASTTAAQSGLAVGVMPVYDASRAGYGQHMAPYLTRLLFERLQGSGFDPVFLNPGGSYSPFDKDAALEYARTASVDVILFPTLQPTESSSDSKRTLVVSVTAVRIAAERREQEFVVKTEVKRSDLQKGFDHGRLVEERVAVPYYGSWSYYGVWTRIVMLPSRRLARQPLGRATARLADQFALEAPARLRSLVGATPSPTPRINGPACEIELRVVYTQQGAASKNYSLLVNDREESLAVIDGIARLRLSGPLVLGISVKDAPFLMPVQPAYLGATFVDCARSARALVLEIGPEGEALLVWRETGDDS